MVSRERGGGQPALVSSELEGAGNGAVPHIHIAPSKGWVSLKLHELWQYRELIYFLIWRDVKVRYKLTVLGVAWAIIQPLFTMVLFSVVFGRLAEMPSDGIPYPIVSYTALVPWTFFSQGLSQASQSLVRYSSLIRRVYFPRLAMPIARVLAGAVDFALAFILLVGMMLASQSSLFPDGLANSSGSVGGTSWSTWVSLLALCFPSGSTLFAAFPAGRIPRVLSILPQRMLLPAVGSWS